MAKIPTKVTVIENGKESVMILNLPEEILQPDPPGTWCECGGDMGDTYFVDDNEDPNCRKHHWRCSKCDAIVQVG